MGGNKWSNREGKSLFRESALHPTPCIPVFFSRGQIHSQIIGLCCWSVMSPFMAFLEYQPSLFKFQEEEVTVPSVLANLRHCRNLWKQIHSVLLRSFQQSHRQASWVSALSYWPSLISRGVWFPGVVGLGDRNHTQCISQCWNLFQAKTQVKHVQNCSGVGQLQLLMLPTWITPAGFRGHICSSKIWQLGTTGGS